LLLEFCTLKLTAEIAQLVEHAAENRGVVSSILTLGTDAGVVQLVERLLAKEKVVGSSPIARSGRIAGGKNPSAILYCQASWPSGKARVCKTLTTGSNPVDASQFFNSANQSPAKTHHHGIIKMLHAME
jgi:hypothetical protein